MGGRAGGGASGGMGSRSRSGGSSWPTLTGSEKQVSWANDIRDRAIKALDSLRDYATDQKGKDFIKTTESDIKSKTDSRFWIDNRYRMPYRVIPQKTESQLKSAIHSTVMDLHRLFH